MTTEYAIISYSQGFNFVNLIKFVMYTTYNVNNKLFLDGFNFVNVTHS